MLWWFLIVTQLLNPLLNIHTENIENKTITAFGYPANYYGGKQMVFVKGDAADVLIIHG